MPSVREKQVALVIGIITVVLAFATPTHGSLIGMAVSCSTALGIGMAARFCHQRVAALCCGVIVLLLLMEQGYYWNLFGRGHGIFTANRLSALAVWAGLVALPIKLRTWRERKSLADASIHHPLDPDGDAAVIARIHGFVAERERRDN